MTNEKKSLGQTAYEKFTKATTPAMTWGDLDAVTRGAWEEASEAAVFAFVDTKRMPDGSPEVLATAAGYERIDGPSFGEMVQTLRIAAKAVCDSEGNAITDEMVEVESEKLDALNKAVGAFDASEDDGREDPRIVGYP